MGRYCTQGTPEGQQAGVGGSRYELRDVHNLISPGAALQEHSHGGTPAPGCAWTYPEETKSFRNCARLRRSRRTSMMSHGSLRLRLRFDRELDCDALQKLTRYIMCVHPFLRCSSCMRVICRLFLEGQMHASAGTSHRTCPLILLVWRPW